MSTAKHHATGRSPCIPRAATGVRQISSPHAAVTPNSHSLKSKGGVGNQPQLSRSAITVGLYTPRKSLEASSKMCSARATHSANHAVPKPDAESAGGAGLKESPVDPNSLWQ